MELQARDNLKLLLQKRDLKFVKTIAKLASFLGYRADHDGNYGNEQRKQRLENVPRRVSWHKISQNQN